MSIGVDAGGRVEAGDFANEVARASDRALRELMSGELRAVILDEIMGRMAGHFCPERARGARGVMQWKVLDRPGGGYDHYEVVIADGVCRLSDEPGPEADVILRVRAVDFLRLVTGNANPMLLFLRGRLRVDGDRALAARIPGFFAFPGTGDPVAAVA